MKRRIRTDCTHCPASTASHKCTLPSCLIARPCKNTDDQKKKLTLTWGQNAPYRVNHTKGMFSWGFKPCCPHFNYGYGQFVAPDALVLHVGRDHTSTQRQPVGYGSDTTMFRLAPPVLARGKKPTHRCPLDGAESAVRPHQCLAGGV